MIKVTFGAKLKAVRNEVGITQEELAQRTGMSFRFLQDVEAGRKQPTITTVFKLADALKTDPGTLLNKVFKQWQLETKESAARSKVTN